MSKIKIKCASESEYKLLRDYFDDIGFEYSQKEGKSLKVYNTNEHEIRHYCCVVGVHPISIKKSKKDADKVSVTGYRAHNNFDGQGLVEDYDLVGSINEMLPVVRCADDAKELDSFLYGLDKSGLAREVFLHSKRRFVDDGRDYEGEPSYPGAVDWRYERGGVFCDDDYER